MIYYHETFKNKPNNENNQNYLTSIWKDRCNGITFDSGTKLPTKFWF